MDNLSFFSTNKYIKNLLMFSILINLIIMYFTLRFCNYGFDLSDESFYLLNIQNPRNYSVTSSQFGFFYNLFFYFFIDSIFLLRICNISVILLISFFLFYFIFIYKYQFTKIESFLFSLVFSSTSLIIFTLWIPTPSYNSLNYTGLLITCIGIVLVPDKELINSNLKVVNFAAWILIGIGGWITFLAKPPSALVLAVLTLIWFFLQHQFKLKYLFISIFTSLFLLLFSALYIDHSISGFINRYLAVINDLNFLQTTDYSIIPFLNLKFITSVNYKILTLICLFLFLLGFLLVKLSNSNNHLIIIISNTLAYFFIVILIFSDNYALRFSILQGSYFIFFLIGVLFGLIIYNKFCIKTLFYSNKRFRVIYFICIPIIYGVGSNNSIYFTIPISSLFFLVALLLFIENNNSNKNKYKLISFLGMFCVLLMASLLSATWTRPYRQLGPLWTNTIPVSLQQNGNFIKLNGPLFKFFNDLHKNASKIKLPYKIPIIDLTGRFPGIVFSLNGQTYGSIFLISGYNYSNMLAISILNHYSCKNLSSAWLLTHNFNFYPHFDSSILNKFNLDITNDYDPVVSIPLSILYDNKGKLFPINITLHKPKDVNIENSLCQPQ
jgi:hypothetical protein